MKHHEAFLILTDGTMKEIFPSNGDYFTLEELQVAIKCECVDVLAMEGGYMMFMDDNQDKTSGVNFRASTYAHQHIIGHAVIIHESQC